MARNLGLPVETSLGMDGRLSSVYVWSRRDNRQIRISDHDLPGWPGSADFYALSPGHSVEWWRTELLRVTGWGPETARQEAFTVSIWMAGRAWDAETIRAETPGQAVAQYAGRVQADTILCVRTCGYDVPLRRWFRDGWEIPEPVRQPRLI